MKNRSAHTLLSWLFLLFRKYRLSQEEKSVFRDIIVSVILSRKVYMYPVANGL
jgi:hypothetical protein